MCLSPFKQKETEYSFPCGKCYECLKRRTSGWSFRLLKEAERSSSAFFLTLTYDTKTVPITSTGMMTLERPYHLQQFFKNLRKKNNDKLKYYAVGEYGSERRRPHYHIILFNCDLVTLIGHKRARLHVKGLFKLDGKTHLDCPSWTHGIITVGELSPASVQYTITYISEGKTVPQFKGDIRVPEYSLMSKGLGSNYLTKNMKKWHKEDINNRMYVPLKDGKKIAMPRYYKEKIYTKVQRQLIGNEIQKNLSTKEMLKSPQTIKNEDYIRASKGTKNQNKTTIKKSKEL